jgi:plastocyanin
MLGWAALFAAVAAHAGPWTITVTDEQGHPLPNAAVWAPAKAGHLSAAPGARAEMAQRNRQFDPQLLVVQTGTAVYFPNFDTVKHHVYSFSPIKPFEIKLYAGTPAAPIVFDKPGVAVLGCNIHDHMVASIVVVDTPTFGRTDAQGRVTLPLAGGEATVMAWHPSMGAEAAPVSASARGGDEGGQLSVALKANVLAPGNGLRKDW